MFKSDPNRQRNTSAQSSRNIAVDNVRSQQSKLNTSEGSVMRYYKTVI